MSNIVRISPVNNPYYPLPPDYDTLTVEGQRQARVNASRQWMLAKGMTRQERAFAIHNSIRFFDTYYLRDDPEGNHYPGFYKIQPAPTPMFHYDASINHIIEPFVVEYAPRGSAKSTNIRRLNVQMLTTCPLRDIGYITNNGKQARANANIYQFQFSYNRRLFDDYAPEYGGRLKPSKGMAPFNTEAVTLSNGSSIFLDTVKSGLRGRRPLVIQLDDPEFDPEASTDMQVFRDSMENLVFREIIPMMTTIHHRLMWQGTIISRRHFLWKAFSKRTLPDGRSVSEDPRFDHWVRMPIDALYDLPDGTQASVWPEYWSLEWLRKREKVIGTPAFNAEYRNRPGALTGNTFFLDEPRHGYWLLNPDDALADDPHSSAAYISFYRRGEKIEMPFREFLRTSDLFIVVDNAPSAGISPTSDRNVCHLLARTPFNEIFSLDLWSDRKLEDVLIRKTFAMANKWKVPFVCPELSTASYSLITSMKHRLAAKLEGQEAYSHLPSLFPFKPGFESKSDRIAAMQFRFGNEIQRDVSAPDFGGLIKLPFYRRSEESYGRLFAQITDFSQGADNGGLEHDDELDTLAMHIPILRKLRTKPASPDTPATIIERLRSGERHDTRTGLPLAAFIDISTIPPYILDEIIYASEPDPFTAPRSVI